MFSVTGSTWVPKTVIEHANSVLTAINTYVAPLGITFVASLGNVVWLFCLGIGAVASLFDSSLTAAKNSFSPSLCNDSQILSMLSSTGLTRIPATVSTLNVKFTATSAGSLVVPAGTHVRVANQDVLFITDTLTTIPASTQVSIASHCDTAGPYQMSAGQTVSIVETLTNFSSVTNTEIAVPGRAQESIADLRKRIITGLATYSNIDGLALAIGSLQGINQAKVYFNTSTSVNLVLQGGASVPPRTLYIVVNGTSSEIARTWAQRMLAPTYGTQTQYYSTLAGQSLAVKYTPASLVPVYVRIYVSSLYARAPGYNTVIKTLIEGLSSSVLIGQLVTQDLVLDALDNFPYAVINGATVSNNNSTFDRTALINAEALPQFLAANVTVIEEP